MIAAATLIIVVLVSLVITRIATVALALTGMSRESARFQARSALSGVGFTTSEAEAVVNHPVRRRIVMLLMLLGSAGVVTVIGTLVISMANADASQRGKRLALVVAGLFVLWLVARSQWVDRRLSPLIAAVLRRVTDIEARDYAALLHVGGDYGVSEMTLDADSWLADRTLGDLHLRDEGVIVLGLTRRDGTYVGAPGFDTTLEVGQTVLVYGRTSGIAELSCRPAGPEGDRRHQEAVESRLTTSGASS